MAKFRGNFGEGNEHETSLPEARMRNLHSVRVNYGCVVEENIEVHDPGTARDQLPASKLAFDRLQFVKQFARRERSFRFDRAVQKPGLC